MSFAWEKFDAAVHTLAGPDTERDRLYEAYTQNFMQLRPKELPAEIRTHFSKLTARLSGDAKDTEKIRDLISSAKDAEIRWMINLILQMHAVLTQYQPFPIPDNFRHSRSGCPLVISGWCVADQPDQALSICVGRSPDTCPYARQN